MNFMDDSCSCCCCLKLFSLTIKLEYESVSEKKNGQLLIRLRSVAILSVIVYIKVVEKEGCSFSQESLWFIKR